MVICQMVNFKGWGLVIQILFKQENYITQLKGYKLKGEPFWTKTSIS